MSELLFEIGTEELPAGFQKPALDQLKLNFINRAKELDLGHGSVVTMGTPRRLTLLVDDLADRQPDSREEIMGPSKQAGFDKEGNPTKAAMGFARSKGAEVSELQVVDTEKGEYLMLVQEHKGEATIELLPGLLKDLMQGFSFAKSMHWGEHSFTFARPVQWIVALHNKAVIPFAYEGITAGNVSRGHRFMANSELEISGIADYCQCLQGAHVLADPVERRESVLVEIQKAAADRLDPEEAHVAIDESLVDTVCNLVEKPFGVCGSFDERFLELPDEALITSMREHQKYFPVVDNEERLLPYFIAVNNTDVKNPDLTRTGHERVLRARLEDAYFFFGADKKTKLVDRLDNLTGIIFQAKLGTMLEKSERIVKLSRLLAEKFVPDAVDEACRAARLCKTDLLTDMVGEFPSLQGNMGCAYALHDGESPAVALAIQEHYLPKRAGDKLPSSALGAVVGLADRLDTLCGCFGIGQLPTGTTDPFGLRRIALAVLHILEHFDWTLSLHEVVHKSLSLYGDKVDGSGDTVKQVLAFIRGRFVNDQLAAGKDGEAVEAVTSVQFDDVNDALQKIQSLINIRGEEAFSVLAESFKRIRNIIKANSETTVDGLLFKEPAEKELASVFDTVSVTVLPLLEQHDYSGALASMLALKEPVDEFFNEVMVMDEDMAVRTNRLNLLTAIATLFLKVGDISKNAEELREKIQMDIVLLDAEQRVLGALLEKELATPDHYPLSLNSLLNACNQKSSRDPVVEYDDTTVLHVINELKSRSFIRSSHLGRVIKYEQCFTDRFNLLRSEAALLAVLLLRGPQTPGELRSRTGRMASFDSVEMLMERLQILLDAGLIKQLARQPGQKESRYCHLLGGEPDESSSRQEGTGATVVVRRSAPVLPKMETTTGEERIKVLEDTVQRLEGEVRQLRSDLDRFREEFD